MTAERTCDLEPFSAQIVAQVRDLESAGSALQLFIQQLEGYLFRFKEAVCEDFIEIVNDCCGGGPTSISFLDLTDTPSSYAGAAGYAAVVNGTEDGLEFQAGVADLDGLTLNHSLTEQATNRTYLSGETIYQKTVVRAGNLPTAGTNVAHGITGLGSVLAVRAFCDRSNGDQVPIPYSTTSVAFAVALLINATNVSLNVGGSWTGAGNVLSNFRITLFYTKT